MSTVSQLKQPIIFFNSLRRPDKILFNACWAESVKPILYYCNTLPTLSIIADQR